MKTHSECIICSRRCKWCLQQIEELEFVWTQKGQFFHDDCYREHLRIEKENIRESSNGRT